MDGVVFAVNLPIATDIDFEAFYRSHYQKALRLTWLLTNGSADSDDLVQDAFMRVQRRAALVVNPAAYLRITVVNLCRERHRRQERDSARRHMLASVSSIEVTPFDSGILERVANLPYSQRAVLVLRYWADLPDTEIADVLGVRLGTVRSLVHRATRRLHKEISDDDQA